jgi:PAS domain S-box-containing protein
MTTVEIEELLAKLRYVEERLKTTQERLAAAEHPREAQLLRRSHMFDVVLSNLPDLICTFDLNGCFTYANAALLGVWQKTLEAILGKNTFDLGYPPELAARIQQEVKNVIATRQPVKNLTPFKGAAGEIRVYEYIFSPVLGADHAVQEVTCTARDVTDRENMGKELALSQQRLQQVLAQAPVAIIVLRGRDLLIELANPFYHELVQNRQLVGRTLAEAIPDLGRDVLDVLGQVLATGKTFTADEWLIPYAPRGDGDIEDHWFNVVYQPLREPDGSVLRVIAVCSDVTQQVLARRELERANRELEEFAYVASHDLREPLRMIGIYTELLHRRYLGGDRQAGEYAGFVRQGVERIEELIHDLLTYSRTIHGDDDAWGTADLNESLLEALKSLEVGIGETHATVQSETLPTVRGEVSQFALVFQNLLSNSLKYHRQGLAPEIAVSSSREGEKWIVSVRDNGIGFEPQYEQRIFGLFKRLHKDEFPGTGLGLAICERIIERYGGRIWAEGRAGQGATFHMALSVAP